MSPSTGHWPGYEPSRVQKIYEVAPVPPRLAVSDRNRHVHQHPAGSCRARGLRRPANTSLSFAVNVVRSAASASSREPGVRHHALAVRRGSDPPVWSM